MASTTLAQVAGEVNDLKQHIQGLERDLFGHPDRPDDHGILGRMEEKMDSFINASREDAKHRHNLVATYAAAVIVSVSGFVVYVMSVVHIHW